jgi:predicted P-loop ATPase
VDNKANHIVPILQGIQGAYKTTWITSLCPDALRDYMHIGTVTGDKDSLIALCETFLFVDDELETINRKEIGIFKRIVTQSEIKVRAPYGRMTETRKRRASFIGSVNRTTFLNDETGSRRFPVLAVEGLINMDARRAIPTAQLWAQAQHIYRSGEVHWFDAGDVKVIERNNAAHQHRSDADELLARWYVPCERATPHAVELSTTDVAVQLAGKVAAANPDVRIQMSDRFVQSVGKALTAQGYTRAQRKIGGQPRYLWSLREVTASDAVSDEAQDELF